MGPFKPTSDHNNASVASHQWRKGEISPLPGTCMSDVCVKRRVEKLSKGSRELS
uniref:Uncharacterized protein n=1 Tax=Setaria viridis TaxID=4556 RepID=A0A4U6UHL2_SETVI|nr:hypothetical protein SEVIR_5G197350v2 [Setaria viridis]